MSAPTERRRGFTVLELMVASAVGLIIVTAAVAAFDLQSQFARNTERLLSAQSAAGLGSDDDAARSGERRAPLPGRRPGRLGGPNFAAVVRPYDNLGQNIVTLQERSGRRHHRGRRQPGRPRASSPAPTRSRSIWAAGRSSRPRLGAQVDGGRRWAHTHRAVSVAPTPFTAGELASQCEHTGPLVMFWTDDVHCIGSDGEPASVSVSGPVATVLRSHRGPDRLREPPGRPALARELPGGADATWRCLHQRRRYLVYRTATRTRAGRPGSGSTSSSNASVRPRRCAARRAAPTSQPPADARRGRRRHADRLARAGHRSVAARWLVSGATSSADRACGFDLALWHQCHRPSSRASIIGAQIYVASRGPEV